MNTLHAVMTLTIGVSKHLEIFRYLYFKFFPVSCVKYCFQVISVRIYSPILCELKDGSKTYVNDLVRDMVMDQSFAVKNVSSINEAFKEMFEYRYW